MSLSSYTSLSFDHEGKAYPRGEFITPLGTKASIHRECLHVRENNEIVMEVNEGRLWYKDLGVWATQKEGTFFVVVSDIDYDKKMLGIGVYDPDGDAIYRHIESFIRWLKTDHQFPFGTARTADLIAQQYSIPL